MADNSVGTIYYEIDVNTDQAVAAVRTVATASKNVSDKLGLVEKTTTGVNAELRRVKSSVSPAYAALASFEDQATALVRELDAGRISTEEFNNALTLINPTTKKNSAAFAGLGKRAGQAGIQVQQFVGQVTTGTNVMTAMSMQAADLGFVLGFPLLGAVAGITASLAGPFITALMSSEDQLDKVKEAVQGLRDEITKPTEAQTIKALEQDTRSLEKALKDLSSSSRDTRNDAKDALQDLTGVSSDIFGSMDKTISAARKRIKQNTVLIEQQIKSMRSKIADSVQTPIPESDGFELTDYFAEQEKLRQDELDKRARYAQGVIAQMQQQAASETEAADTALDMQLQAIEEARTQKIELGQSYDDLEADAKQLHADKLAEIDAKRTQAEEAEAAKRLQAKQLELNAYAQLGGQLTGLMSSLGMEQTALGKAIFLANQAIAVAGIIVSTQQAAAQALTLDPTGGLSSRVTTLGYASAAIAAGVAVGETFSGRQTGGPTEAGTPYRVLEAGKPEMFSMGGRDYLLGGQKGQVTPLSSSGAAAGTNVNITMINQGTQSEVVSNDGQGNITVRSFVADMNSRGPMFKSITNNTNATSKTK